jgi:CDP-diglyceride synthetase
MKIKYVYLSLAIIGTVLTVSQLIPFIQLNGVNIILMFQELFRNEATSFFGYDLLISAFAALIFMIVDGNRIKMPRLWIPIASVFVIGIALGLPLYLYLREVHLEKNGKSKIAGVS